MNQKYKSNFLTEVIARVDFLNPIQEIQESLPKSVSDNIVNNFPIAEPRKVIAHEFRLSNEKVQPKGEARESKEWKFHGIKRNKTFTLTPDSIFIQYTQYQSFHTLLSEYLSPLSALFGVCEDLQARRLGLRYINNISVKEKDPLSWGDYINKNMLCIFEVHSSKESISRAFHNLELNFGDYNLSFRYGMHNPDYPAPIKKKIYVLDFDAYSQVPQNMDEISRNLTAFHNTIEELFESSITDKLRSVLNV